ncbi:MAG TPA: hypothetical protein VFZ95_13470 [Steroidobacteraceae bacterium]
MSGEAPRDRVRLPLRRILFGAFALSWRHRAELARATGLPVLAVIACTLLWNVAGVAQIGSAVWTLHFVYAIAISWLAISVHRLMLLDGEETRPRFDSVGLRRLGLFVGTVIGATLVYLALLLVLMNLSLLPFSRYVSAGETPSPSQAREWSPWLFYGACVLAMWPIARLSPMFPAIAVDRGFDPITAWRMTRGNGWKLVVIIGVLPWTMKWIVAVLQRDGATRVEFGILLVLTSVFTVIQVAALSLSYWELTQPAPPPTSPPA